MDLEEGPSHLRRRFKALVFGRGFESNHRQPILLAPILLALVHKLIIILASRLDLLVDWRFNGFQANESWPVEVVRSFVDVAERSKAPV